MWAHVFDAWLFGLALYLVGRLVWRRSSPLPPGPPGWPLIGNLFDFPADAPYKTFGAMSGKYGKCMLVSCALLIVHQVLLYPSV